MNAWARDQGIEDEVALLPDGNGDFTRAMGMLADQSGRGFGARSRRYSMVAHDGVVQQIFLENRDGSEDPIERSEEHTSELQSLMRISYAVFCLKKKN